MLERIISGGQTGVDRGAIGAALKLGFPYGGWVPDGRRAEKGGVVPACFEGMKEAGDYRERTRLNIADANATLVLTPGEPTGGTYMRLLTLDVNRPWCSRQQGPERAALLGVLTDQVLLWLSLNPIRVLNVAGPRESKCPGIERLTFDLISQVIHRLR